MDKTYFYNFTKELFAIDSPSGYTSRAIEYLRVQSEKLGYRFNQTNKGNGYIMIEGLDPTYTVGFTSHVDTLGLMVRSINADGTLSLTNIGGPIIPTLDGEYCTIYTRSGEIYEGTILSKAPAAHVYPDASKMVRDIDHIVVRIDEEVKNKEDVIQLGIQSGDFVCFEPKTTITESDFIKSRFLDDKISVSIVFSYLKYLKDHHLKPKFNIVCLFSTYEEVGHGMAYLPVEIHELISVDMGCVGLDLNCTEYNVSICAKDSSGPYDYDITTALIEIAKHEKIDYAVDIYPYYGSDTSAALAAGNDIRGALIGPGVHASHGMERTHFKGIKATIDLMIAYTL